MRPGLLYDKGPLCRATRGGRYRDFRRFLEAARNGVEVRPTRGLAGVLQDRTGKDFMPF